MQDIGGDFLDYPMVPQQLLQVTTPLWETVYRLADPGKICDRLRILMEEQNV